MTARSIVLLALGLLMAGCMTTEQVAQRNNERCAARGLQPDTPAFNNCVTQIETERLMRMDARHRELTEKSGSPFAR